jgi:hypothetical protein
MSDQDFDISTFEVQPSTGLDCFLARNATMVTPLRRKVASIQDLSSFVRLSADDLVHKATKDLWTIRRQGDGGLFVERAFDDNGSPLKV